LSSWYPSLEHATLGNFVQRHAQAVAKKHRVSVVYSSPYRKRGLPADQMIENGPLTEYIAYFSPGLNTIHKRKNAFMRAFDAYMKQEGRLPDVVHLNVLYPAGNQARWLEKQFGVPFIVTEHWTGYHPEHKTKVRWDQRRSMLKTAQAAKIIAPVSAQLKTSMEKWGLHARYEVVPNVVDTDLFLPPTRNTEDSKQKEILHVSSLVDDHKNISGMLHAVLPVLQSNEQIHFRIIGDGDIEPYQKLAKAIGIPEAQFSIEGEKSIGEIAQAMQKAELFVMFSRYENLPCVILEAFACGVPVVSTDVGGIREHLHPERGILIQNENQKELTQAIERALNTHWNRAEIREYAVRHFSEEAIAESFTQLYRSAIDDALDHRKHD
jgi:glycosyltransferase involved in cell wall biosynthesis